MMRELQADGSTIVLATHDMAEAEQLSDRVAILLGGRLVSIGIPLELTSTGAGLTKISVRSQSSSLSASDGAFPAVTQSLSKDDYQIYFNSDVGPSVAAILEHLNRHGDVLVYLRVDQPSLEDRFLEITKSGAAQ